jgi:hypothetical protein
VDFFLLKVKLEIVSGITPKRTGRGEGSGNADGKDYALVVRLHGQLERKVEQGNVHTYITQG